MKRSKGRKRGKGEIDMQYLKRLKDDYENPGVVIFKEIFERMYLRKIRMNLLRVVLVKNTIILKI
eukprot:snap_masked-scaffold_3-processed-gene-17.14-mRNA-1 protein AED:1.00 eAED:1.00 QI:0/0/0/0/1/1/2/0/64